ncbi:MAG: peptide deformylase [Clostridiales bacterium]|nr:peptide deformylase [Clostridiales bacterium]
MAIREVRICGDEILRKKSREVTQIDDRILTLLDDMSETMYKEDGVGLAAPQIGVLKRIIVLDDGNGLIECINPEIKFMEGSQDGIEGCLSVPDLRGNVVRPSKVVVTALDRNGEEVEYVAEGFLARIFCHEIDHLEGILFKDKASKLEKI